MSGTSDYTPPKVWTWNKASGGRFANINRPIAGPTHDKELPVGRHPILPAAILRAWRRPSIASRIRHAATVAERE